MYRLEQPTQAYSMCRCSPGGDANSPFCASSNLSFSANHWAYGTKTSFLNWGCFSTSEKA